MTLKQKPPAFLSTQVSHSRRFYFRVPTRKSPKLAVYCGGLENSAHDYVIDRRVFPYMTVEFVAAGKGAVWLDGKEYALTPGSAFTYGPGIPHRIVSSPENPLVKYFMNLSGSETVKLFRALKIPPGSFFFTDAQVDIRDLFENLITEGLAGHRHSQKICNLLCEALLYKFAENRTHRSGKISERHLTYQRCRKIAETDYLQIQSLAEFARRCGISSEYLCRLYQAYDHQTPYHHLQRLRMVHAANLLTRPGTLVKHAADALGIADVYHFSRAFKNVHGVSPRTFKSTTGIRHA